MPVAVVPSAHLALRLDAGSGVSPASAETPEQPFFPAILHTMFRPLPKFLPVLFFLGVLACTASNDDDSTGDDDDAGDDDDNSPEPMVTIHGGVEIITIGEYRPAQGIHIYEDGDTGYETWTDTEEGDWYLDLPANQSQALVRGIRDDLTPVMFLLDLRWQRERVDHLVLFNPYMAAERAEFFSEAFGMEFNPERGLLHVGAVSRTHGTEYAGASVDVVGLAYEASYAVDDNLGPSTTTDSQGILAFLNVEIGTAQVTVLDPNGEPCIGLSPVPVEAGSTTHVVYECP